MSGSCMNFAKSGYRRVKKTPEELKTVFLDTARTRKVRENSIVRVPDGDGQYTEGRVLFIGDEDPSRSLDDRKHEVYLTVCFNEESLSALLVFKHQWPSLEVIKY